MCSDRCDYQYTITCITYFLLIFQLLCSLPVPELQDTVENLFFFLLLGFQHSETAFHRIVSTLPDILTKLQKNATSQTVFGTKSKILERLVEATYFMLKLFPDFPDLYSSLLKKMEELTSIPQPDDNRVEGRILRPCKTHLSKMGLKSNNVWQTSDNFLCI